MALVTGILLLGIWQPNRSEFLAPGGLSANHGQIWSSGNNEERCIACHAAGSTNPINWLIDAVSGGSHIGEPQYQKCLNCHAESLGPDHSLLVHNVSNQALTEISSQQTQLAGNSLQLFASPVNHSGEIACAHCHQEHHGADHNLAAMTDTQCQSCHQNQFKSFDDGHPEFTTVMRGKRTKIAFDHFSHQSKHFSVGQQSFDCKMCHEGDQFGAVMQIKPFEQSCAQCHNKKIEASLTQGLPFFSLPTLNTEVLKRNGLDVGQWPELADGGFDGAIPPLMKVLLSSDERAVDAIKFLGPEFDLFEIDEANVAQLKAAHEIAVAAKSLIYDLAANGQNAMATRLEKIAGDSITHAQLRKMLGNLPADTFSQAQKQWFPNLADELDLIKKDENDIPLGTAANPSSKQFSVQQSAFVQEDDEVLSVNPLKDLFKPKDATSQRVTDSDIQSSSTNSQANSPSASSESTEPESTEPESTEPESTEPESTRPESTKQDPSAIQFSDLPPVEQPANDSDQVPDVGNKDVIKIRNGDKPTESAETLIVNPLQNKTDLTPPFQFKTKRSDSKNILNPYVKNANPVPVEPSQLKIESINGPSMQDSNEQGAAKETKVLPQIENQQLVQQNQNHGSAAAKPQAQIPESELLANNPLEKIYQQTESPPAQQDGSNDVANGNTPKVQNSGNAGQDIAVSPLGPENASANNPGDSNDSGSSNDPKQPPNASTDSIANKADKTNQQLPKPSDKKARKEIVRLPANQMVPLGGWYRDDATFTIAYRQSGHADTVTSNWYDFVGAIPASYSDPMYADFAKLMTKPTSPGLCASCHSVDSTEGFELKGLDMHVNASHKTADSRKAQNGKTLKFNWRTEYRNITKREFTRFSHRPHLLQNSSNQCSSCHEITPGSSVMNNYFDSDTQKTRFNLSSCEAGFAPISKSNCIQCHNDRSQIQNCTQCHNYHIGSSVSRTKK